MFLMISYISLLFSDAKLYFVSYSIASSIWNFKFIILICEIFI